MYQKRYPKIRPRREATCFPRIVSHQEDSSACAAEQNESPLKGILFNSLASSEFTRYAQGKVGTEGMPKPGSPEASYACAVRLRNLAQMVEGGRIGRDDLVRNINYAVNVLEAVYVDETKRLCNEDDDLSEVNPGAVPNEVRDWLASTFTRASTSIKPNREKPKFRSVANAIRAGIMVDRIYRRTSSSANVTIPPNILLLLKGHLDDWSFNIFELNEVSDRHALKYMGLELLQRYDLIAKLKLNVTMLENFLLQLEVGYSKYKNPYHNLIHGADVAQTCHQVMSQSKLVNWLTDLEIFSTIFAALIHDFEHTGTTNTFHVNTGSDLALLYNDRGVLENHHISAVFRLLKKDDLNIVNSFSKEDYREFRGLVIEMVLNTDMSLHFQQIKTMKNLLSMPEKLPISVEWSYLGSHLNAMRPRRHPLKEFPRGIDKAKALSLVMHCADISHPAKAWDIHHEWTILLMEEFFRQGDREAALNLAFSPLCDRKTTLVAQSQIGFIDFIVEPSFELLGDMLVKIMSPLFDQQQKQREKELLKRAEKDTANAANIEKELKEVTSSKYVYVRPWSPCIGENKTRWKEKAKTEVPNSFPKPKLDEANGDNNPDDASSEKDKDGIVCNSAGSGETQSPRSPKSPTVRASTPLSNTTGLDPIEETG